MVTESEKLMNYDNLLFRRQFLITSGECHRLKSWKNSSIGLYNLYVHPDLPHCCTHDSRLQCNIILIGYALDPSRPEIGSHEIVEGMLQHDIVNPETIAKSLYSLSGRFVLVVNIQARLYIFHDACGLRTVYYSFGGTGVHIASEPNLLSIVTSLIKGPKFDEYLASDYKKENLEHWIPAGVSLYENVSHLIPNHYMDVSAQQQIRYWPTRNIGTLSSSESAERAADILVGSLEAAHTNFALALPLTAGWDSRTLLSACRNIASDVFFYTLEYRSLSPKSPDVRVPQRLLSRMGYEHHLIECRGEVRDEKFKKVYDNNTDMAHFLDWGMMAYWMHERYPTERVCMKGSCAEVARCFYYPTGKHRELNAPMDFISLEEGWSGLQFAHEAIRKWLVGAGGRAQACGVDLFDLFYWEHRMGSWQAQSQLEWDIEIEQYTPFNNRQLLETLLCVEPKYRCFPKYTLFKKMMTTLWPDVLTEAINPSIRNRLKGAIMQLGALDVMLTMKQKMQLQRKSKRSHA